MCWRTLHTIVQLSHHHSKIPQVKITYVKSRVAENPQRHRENANTQHANAHISMLYILYMLSNILLSAPVLITCSSYYCFYNVLSFTLFLCASEPSCSLHPSPLKGNVYIAAICFFVSIHLYEVAMWVITGVLFKHQLLFLMIKCIKVNFNWIIHTCFTEEARLVLEQTLNL